MGEWIHRSRVVAVPNHRATEGLDRYLREAGVPGIQGIDTRALVRHIRDKAP